MKAFIDRVQEVNPLLNCVVDERFADALKEAEDADKLIASGTMTEEEIIAKKPFLGVPISTKDCIMVKGLLNTSGLYHRRDFRGDKDAPAIAQMREAGAIPFCITNTSELCMWWESVNCVHGRTNNPYDCNRIVGGSSGGEGAIQGAAASPFGIGSDIGGSIRMPAFFNGIFGHKPTRFVINNDGQHPAPYCDEQASMLSSGPMCRYACDLKPMMKVMAIKEKLPQLKLDEPIDVKKLKIYYQENDLGGHLVSPVDKDIQEAFRKVINYFKNTLKVEVNRVQIQRTKNTSAMWLANMKSTKSPAFMTQIAGPGNKANAFAELGKWIFGRSHHTFIAIMTALTEQFGVEPGSEKHQYLLSERDKIIEDFRGILKDEMSVFLYPTHPTVAPYHNEPMFRAFNFSYTALINLLQLPACTIPLGLGSEGLPLGLQAVANYHNDRLCLAVACELEKAFGGWTAPEVH
jgi:fatty acid amide hydrolase 2